MIQTETAKAGPYLGDGVQTDFPFDFPVDDYRNIEVYLNGVFINRGYRILEDNPAELSPKIHHGGTVRFDIPPTSGSTVNILRYIPILQETDLQNHTAFHAEVVERALDKLTMISQELKEELSRCLKVATDEGVSPQTFMNNLMAAKDIALTAAESAANSNASCAAAVLTIQTIWGEITGDPAAAIAAVDNLKEAFEAAGSVTAAAEAGRASVNEASLAAITYAKREIEDAKTSSVEVLSATTQDRTAELVALLSETTGAEGAVIAAVESINASIESLEGTEEEIKARINELTQQNLASVNAAASVADGYRIAAKASADLAAAEAEAAGNDAARIFQAISQALTAKSEAATSAQNALKNANDSLANLNQIRGENGLLSQVVGHKDSAYTSAQEALQNARDAADRAREIMDMKDNMREGLYDTLSESLSTNLSSLVDVAKNNLKDELVELIDESFEEHGTPLVDQSIAAHNLAVNAHEGLFNGKADTNHTHCEYATASTLSNYVTTNTLSSHLTDTNAHSAAITSAITSALGNSGPSGGDTIKGAIESAIAEAIANYHASRVWDSGWMYSGENYLQMIDAEAYLLMQMSGVEYSWKKGSSIELVHNLNTPIWNLDIKLYLMHRLSKSMAGSEVLPNGDIITPDGERLSPHEQSRVPLPSGATLPDHVFSMDYIRSSTTDSHAIGIIFEGRDQNRITATLANVDYFFRFSVEGGGKWIGPEYFDFRFVFSKIK